MHLPGMCYPWYLFVDLGKHKDHDVKTVRKSQPIVKSEVENQLGKFENNI